MGIATKWPRLIVVGDNVTPDQADEILIRTNQWRLFSNDKEWQAIVTQVMAEFGYPAVPDPFGRRRDVGDVREHIAAQDRWEKRLGILDLHYLHNWQIMSAWFGGPHGWCDWNGQIGATTFNIGKWPTEHEVTEDWAAIAAAFPYLRLTAQCIEDEGEGVVAGTWTVTGGTVAYDDGPADRIAEPEGIQVFTVGTRHGERGVEYPRLRQAFKRVVDHA